MRKARLIKKDTMLQAPATPKVATEPSLKRAVHVVKNWMQEQQDRQTQQTRQMFAALFVHSQT